MIIIFILCSALFLYMTGLFLLGLILKNNGVADIGYGVGFIVLTAVALYLTIESDPYVIAMAALVFLWGARLAVRIFLKNRGKPEDFRYKAWRDAWGVFFIPRSFLQIYMLQGAIIFIVALPMTLSAVFPAVEHHLWPVYAGILLWIAGFLFESIADFQLDHFIHNPANRGRIMTLGLWRYSRHPNYFGESLMWWALALIASGLSSQPFLVFISPILITFLLLFVSGVPMLEKRWKGNREWEAYARQTSVFVPLPPRAR